MMISVREALELILIVMAIIALVVWVVRNGKVSRANLVITSLL
jgi:hypothetical protein